MKSHKSGAKDFWETKIAAQLSSELSRREFCRQNAIQIHKFNYRLKLAQKSPSSKGADFARVLVNKSEPSLRAEVSIVRLNLRAGMSLDVDSRIATGWLSGLIKELRATPGKVFTTSRKSISTRLRWMGIVKLTAWLPS